MAVRSMTGYGAGSAEAPAARVTVELRGVNQRFLDVKLAAPREYAPWESELRERVRAVVERGRVELSVTRIPRAAGRRYRVAIRHDLARAWLAAARELERRHRLDGSVTMGDLLRQPDLVEVSEHAPDVGRELPALRRALAVALRAFDAERRREGRALQRDMQGRVAALRRAAIGIRRRLPVALRGLRTRLTERLERIVADAAVDGARLAHEAALLVERGDITEELVRLDSHLAALAAALREQGSVGKRIDFLLQEVHRELNTVGAKSADLQVGTLVLGAKGEVEKLREQVQNVE
jgi:uncharacterized protein (TIGR00255 family)